MNKRIIIVGPAASGKDYLKKKFIERGFVPDISYTTRPPREGEVDGVDYHFMDGIEFHEKYYEMYETAKHGDYWYGTGLWEWNNVDIFIMETEGISQISEEDRKHCFIIYLNIPKEIRINRLREKRKWTPENIKHRLKTDHKKFSGFGDYDLILNNPYF